METFGALLVLFGVIAFYVALFAALYSLFGIWAAALGGSLLMVIIGRFLLMRGDER